MLRRFVLAAVFVAACGDDGPARVKPIEDLTEVVGGPGAIADLGDFLLENDMIRVAISDAGNPSGPGVFGGSLIDADLRRPQAEFRGGQGLDQFSEMFPTVNIVTPNVRGPEDFTMLCDGEPADDGCSGEEVTIHVNAQPGNFLETLRLLWDLFPVIDAGISFETDYRLRAGARYVEIETTAIRRDDPDREEDPPLEMRPLPEGNVFDNIVTEAGSGLDKGVAGGDFLFFGRKIRLFVPGLGFGPDKRMRDIFALGGNTVETPVAGPALIGVGDRVSYGVGTLDSDYRLPLLDGAFTAGFTHGIKCASSDAACRERERLTYKRFFIVGDGDAASIMDVLYELRGTPVGKVSGNVRDGRSGRALSGVDVLVFADPGDGGRAPESVGELIARNVARTRGGTDPGKAGIVNHVITDVGYDPKLDGSFHLTLPAGRYWLVARQHERPEPAPAPIDVTAGGEIELTLVVPDAGSVSYTITDENGERIPATLHFGQCFNECGADDDCPAGQSCTAGQCYLGVGGACTGASECDADEACLNGRCTCVVVGAPEEILGDGSLGPGTATFEYTASGTGEVTLRPGVYEVVASRGMEYEIDRQMLTVISGKTTQLTANVVRSVDTRGWISGDFHVHGIGSFDSGVTHHDRVRQFAATGVELLSSSDHDYISDLRPAIRELHLERWVKGQVGIESTTVEVGHFLGYPVAFDALDLDHGAWKATWFDATRASTLPTVDFHLPPPLIMDAIRGLADPALGVVPLVTIAHPRDGFFGYFDQFNLTQFSARFVTDTSPSGTPRVDCTPCTGANRPSCSLEPETASLAANAHPILAAGCDGQTDDGRSYFDFSGFEVIELLNGKRYEVLRTPTRDEVRRYSETLDRVTAEAAELAATHGMEAVDSETLAAAYGTTRELIHRTPAEQQELLATAQNAYGNPDVAPFDDTPGCEARELCASDAACAATQRCDTTAGRCVESCAGDDDCGTGEVCADPGLGATVCVEVRPVPCHGFAGTIDDWFLMLNYGVHKTGVGNSDSHTLKIDEGGYPRTWIRSSAETPAAIDIAEIAANTRKFKAVASTGPFVTFTVNDGEIGDTVATGGSPVTVHIKVQTPTWYDVDRIEVYRNAELIKVIDIGSDKKRSVVKYDSEFTDEPVRDSWYVVIVSGTKGRDMSPVFASMPHLKLQINDIVFRALGGVDAIAGLLGGPTLTMPRAVPALPYAVTNPIWVDVDGGGYVAPAAGMARRAALHGQTPWSSKRRTEPFTPIDRKSDEDRVRTLRLLKRLMKGH